MSIQAIQRPTPARPSEKFTRGQRIDVAQPSLIEIAGVRMVACMVTPPVAVWRQCHHAEGTADPIVRKAAAEERAVSAIVLDHEEADQQTRRGHLQQEGKPIALVKSGPDQDPDDDERYRRNRQFEDTPRIVGLAIAGKQLRRCADFRYSLAHICSAPDMPPKKHGMATDATKSPFVFGRAAFPVGTGPSPSQAALSEFQTARPSLVRHCG